MYLWHEGGRHQKKRNEGNIHILVEGCAMPSLKKFLGSSGMIQPTMEDVRMCTPQSSGGKPECFLQLKANWRYFGPLLTVNWEYAL